MKQNKKKYNPRYLGKNPPKKAKREKKLPVCPVCWRPIKMIPYEEMDFHGMTPPNHPTHDWVCSAYPRCDTYVRANAQGKPAGTLAGASLRTCRRYIHAWQQMMSDDMQTNKDAFRGMCAYQLGITNQELYHSAELNESQCMVILNYLKSLYENDKAVRELVEGKYYNTAIWKHVHGVFVVGGDNRASASESGPSGAFC